MKKKDFTNRKYVKNIEITVVECYNSNMKNCHDCGKYEATRVMIHPNGICQLCEECFENKKQSPVGKFYQTVYVTNQL